MNQIALGKLKKRLGVNDLRAAGRARNYPYQIPFDFTAVADGASASIQNKVTAAAVFVVYGLSGAVIDTATGAEPQAAAAPYGSLLPRLRLSYTANEGAFQSGPVVWPGAVGNAQQPFWFAFRPVFGAGTNIVLTVYNNTGKTLSGQVVFNGYLLGV